MATSTQIQFRGLRNDRGPKFIGEDYFSNINNFNFNSLIGADKMYLPEIIYPSDTSSVDTYDIDGIFEFKYLNINNVLVTEDLAVWNGSLYKNWISGSPSLLHSGLSAGKVDFAIFQDKVFITNGIDNVIVYNGVEVYEMGAPSARINYETGNLNGQYLYAMTYVTSGGEEVIGSISNLVKVALQKVTLVLPIGYSGVISRNIYRTEAGSSTLKLLTNIADNVTTTYTDNIADASLTTTIPATNNALPRPKFITVNSERLVGTVSSKYPTQLWATDTDIELWDAATFTDISNFSGDNTPTVGMAQDYNKIIVGTQKNIYIVDVSSEAVSVDRSRSNVGIKDGYTMSNMPSEENFPGGVMFVSSLNDVRLFNGNFAQPVATSLDNLRTDNWAQAVRGTLNEDIAIATNLYSLFFDYKYHLIVDNKVYTYEIRTGSWGIYEIKTDSYRQKPNVFGVVNNKFYTGQKDLTIIEENYKLTKYRGENVESKFTTGQIMGGTSLKYFKDLKIFFVSSAVNKMEVTITLDGDYTKSITHNVDLDRGSYYSKFFNSKYYDISNNIEDYLVFHINRHGHWIDFEIKSDYPFYYRGYAMEGEDISNKEM